MPFVKRHRAGEEMPKVVHLDPDPRAFQLCEDLVRHPSIQALILGGSRYVGRWDEQSDLDLMVILADEANGEQVGPVAAQALAVAKEFHYPGHMDWDSRDHGISRSGWMVSMEYFLTHRRTHNHPMAQAAKQGRIFAESPEEVGKYQHDGDTSNEWELVTLHKLRLAARQVHIEESHVYIYERFGPMTGDIFRHQGGNAYWQLWHAGSAILSIPGVTYPNRSLVNMAQLILDQRPGLAPPVQERPGPPGPVQLVRLRVGCHRPDPGPAGDVEGPGSRPRGPVGPRPGTERRQPGILLQGANRNGRRTPTPQSRQLGTPTEGRTSPSNSPT